MAFIDTVLKASAALSLAVASVGVAYYYAVHLPERDRRLDLDRAVESARVLNEKAQQEYKAEANRIAAEAQKEEIASRYRQCVSLREQQYSKTWDDHCVRVDAKNKENVASCIKMGGAKDQCEKTWIPAKALLTDCTLPTSLADRLNSELDRGRARCLQEFQAGLN